MLIKSNYLIWLIAMMLVAFVKLFSRKKYIKDAVFIIAAVAVSMSVQPAVKALYEYRADVDLGDSIPYTSWISMGLNESDLAPGWYNYFQTVTNFEDSNYNADEASKRSMEKIKERLKYFADNPQYSFSVE